MSDCPQIPQGGTFLKPEHTKVPVLPQPHLDSDCRGVASVLARTLRGLERDGLVTRTVFPTIPPRVDYELTDLGRGLSQPVIALGTWAIEHLTEIEDARARFDRRNDVADPPADRVAG